MEPLFWFSFKGPGGNWDVHFMPMEKYDGLCVYSARAIYIDPTIDKQRQSMILLHELLHVAYGRGNKRTRRREELYVRRISPPLWDVLGRLGCQWPARPNGYESMRRTAKRLMSAEDQ